ncbi:cyclic nucleotide-binding domain protein (macronuclear) [Tetrahymena thermophila SB210]|uniref:Cyclic nucleotide-binding domain protein n=1 Tax=Tetrahymena thermophila (strain SB210) TaxID=312017 RepID=I7M0T5_TETTS|nr:cyclic nucleotide-binding domain protein [Tetrahymena thermophila SB210]EAR90908.2 cyclic nucleotide-binding domain protein [Tetrahymena thermophila SB210]|eukprot:XP_001011153.2 cyclic nucleotide-binding domain protein [Tetrahymena thermophila SB210]
MSAQKLIDSTWAEKYLYAFYFCTVTMSTVGYGDIVPRSPLERIVCSLMIVTSAGIFGFSVNTISGILQDLTKNERNIMEKIYYWRQNEEYNQEEEERMVKQLSDQLRNDLLIESNKIILKECQFFQNNFSEELIKSMVNIIQEKNYTPEEIIYLKEDQNQSRAIYFVQEGIVEIFMETQNNQQKQNNQFKSLKKLKKGDFFGEIEFFTDIDKQQDFMQIIKDYPQDYEQFCYIKDKMINQQDFQKIHLQCHSCASQSHVLERCPFVNFIPNKPKVILSYNRSEPQFERNQSIRRQRKFYYNQDDLLQMLESFQEVNEEFLEEYENNFLDFQISKCDICQSQQQTQSQGQTSTIDLFNQVQHNSNNNNNTIKNNSNFSKQSNIHILNPTTAAFGYNTPKKRSNSNLTNEDQISQKINQHKKAYLQNNCMIMSQFGTEDQEVFDSASSPIKIVKNFKSNIKMSRIKTIDSKHSKSQSPFNRSTTQEDNFMIQSQNVDIFDRFDNSPNNFHNEKSSFSNSQQSINPQFSNNNLIRQSTLDNKPSKHNNVTSILECIQEQTNNNSSVIPIKNIKLNCQISHKQILFFDPFQGLFEKMHNFLFYYPLNNYTFVLQQTQMDQIQKKKMKNKLLQQQKAALSKLVLKKQLRKTSQATKKSPLLRKQTKKKEEKINDSKDLKSKFSQNYANTFTLQNSPFSEIKKQFQLNSILNTEEKQSQFNQKIDEKNVNDLILLSTQRPNIIHQGSTISKNLNLSNFHIGEIKPDVWSFQNLSLTQSRNLKPSNFKDDCFEQKTREKAQSFQRCKTDHQVYNSISNDISFQNQNIEEQKRVEFSPPQRENKVKLHNFLDLTNNTNGYFEDYTLDNQFKQNQD